MRMIFLTCAEIKHHDSAHKNQKKFCKNRKIALFFRQSGLNYLVFAIMRRKRVLSAPKNPSNPRKIGMFLANFSFVTRAAAPFKSGCQLSEKSKIT